jgi:peptidyl-prolyl cis-trans isomerase C
MHRHVRYLLPIVALALLASACGGGGSSAKLGGNDVAVVGTDHITVSDFNAVMEQAKQSYKQSKQAFPKPGTTAYQSIKTQAVNLLVQRAERAEQAQKLGVKVTDQEVQKRLDSVIKQYFGGSQAKYQAQLKKQNLTDEQVRKDFKQQLIEEKLYNKVTADVKVSDADLQSYYQQHVQLYSQPQSRDVQYMLIKKKSLAQQLYTQLKANPGRWCADAKKYSGDPSTAKNCGKATFSKGQTVAAFDNLLFSPNAKTNVTQAPVYDPTQYKAYFVIRPLSAVKPRKTTPFAQVKASIKQTLEQQQKSTAINTWSSDVQKAYCRGSRVKYQVGYQPSPDPCTALTTSNTTTT